MRLRPWASSFNNVITCLSQSASSFPLLLLSIVLFPIISFLAFSPAFFQTLGLLSLHFLQYLNRNLGQKKSCLRKKSKVLGRGSQEAWVGSGFSFATDWLHVAPSVVFLARNGNKDNVLHQPLGDLWVKLRSLLKCNEVYSKMRGSLSKQRDEVFKNVSVL